VEVCVLVPIRMDGDSLWQSNKYTLQKNHIDHTKGGKYANTFPNFFLVKKIGIIFHRIGRVNCCGVVHNIWSLLLPTPESNKTWICHNGNSFENEKLINLTNLQTKG